MKKSKKKIIVIVGPTASGKSGLAIRLAERRQGCVVNADSMQIYQDLRILSARPEKSDMDRVPHFLYGYADAWTQNSVRDWLNRVVPVLESEKEPVLVGGTGLYLSALIDGLNEIPDVEPAVRERVRQMDIRDVLAMVRDCPLTDPQRLRRALEVQLTTGKPLSYFQAQPRHKVINADFTVIFIHPPREKLYRTCADRLDRMLAAGAVEEVRHLLTLKPTGGVLKAIGVSEISSFLRGEITESDMRDRVLLSTRHYAKRQITWFKHQLRADIVISDPTEQISI